MLRLLVQHPHAEGEISGVLTYVHLVTQALESHPDVEVRVISTRTTSRWQQLAAIRWSTVVHLNSNDPVLVLSARLLGRPTILKVHYHFFQTTHFEYVPMSLGQRLRYEVQFLGQTYGLATRYTVETLLRLAARLIAALMASEVLACSRFLADSMSLPRSVTTAYNPVADSRPSELPATRGSLIFLGRLSRDKGVDLIIEAADLLPPDLQFHITVVGDGPERGSLESSVQARHLQDRFTFTGQLSRSEAMALIADAFALLQPARWQEPAGLTPLEAAALGRISIVARSGGLKEMAGPDAHVFEREDAASLALCMAAVLADPDDALRRGSEAQARVKTCFSVERSVEELLKVAVRLATPKSRRARLQRARGASTLDVGDGAE